jgi:hypothetical protein
MARVLEDGHCRVRDEGQQVLSQDGGRLDAVVVSRED